METLYFPGLDTVSANLGVGAGVLSVVFIAVMLIALILKGFALWHAARNYQKFWFVSLLIVNTLGILEIIYLLWFRKDKVRGDTQSLFNTPAERDSSAQA